MRMGEDLRCDRTYQDYCLDLVDGYSISDRRMYYASAAEDNTVALPER